MSTNEETYFDIFDYRHAINLHDYKTLEYYFWRISLDVRMDHDRPGHSLPSGNETLPQTGGGHIE